MAQGLQKFREIVFQLLYSLEFETAEEGLSLVMRQHAIPKSLARNAKEKAETIWAKKDELDPLIAKKAVGYDLERISRIERAILRMGLYELLHTDLPCKVAIAEAIRLTRKFATAEGAAFVNALLDAVYKEKGNEAFREKQTSC